MELSLNKHWWQRMAIMNSGFPILLSIMIMDSRCHVHSASRGKEGMEISHSSLFNVLHYKFGNDYWHQWSHFSSIYFLVPLPPKGQKVVFSHRSLKESQCRLLTGHSFLREVGQDTSTSSSAKVLVIELSERLEFFSSTARGPRMWSSLHFWTRDLSTVHT